jgi:multidrug transporter EmrE-like cation transporter
LLFPEREPVAPLVFVLVLLLASIHVLWNTLVKQSEDKSSFPWVTTLVATLLLVPVFGARYLLRPGTLSPPACGWAALSGLFAALYVVFLFGAYGRADLSVVYPLSRGVAPLVTVALGGRLLGDSVSPVQGAAVLTLVAGVTSVAVSSQAPVRHTLGRAGLLLSFGTGCMIAGCRLIDRRAMSMAVRRILWSTSFSCISSCRPSSLSGWVSASGKGENC